MREKNYLKSIRLYYGSNKSTGKETGKMQIGAVGQNNFGNKIPFPTLSKFHLDFVVTLKKIMLSWIKLG